MTSFTQSARIFIQDPLHANAIGDIYLADDPAQIAKNGHLFILVNLANPENSYEQFIGAFLEKAINSYYYSVLEDSTKLLEHTLSELNSWLPENLPNNRHVIANLNIVIGNYKDDILNIAYLGDWEGYLFHRIKAVKILDKELAQPNPVKIFQNVITGKLESGYSFLVTNSSLFDYISIEKIRKIISTIPARSSAEQIRNLVANVPNKVSFLSVIIKKTSQPSDQEQTISVNAVSTNNYPYQSQSSTIARSRQSIDQLLETQRKTDQIMTVSSSWHTVSTAAQNIKDKLNNIGLLSWLQKILRQIGYWLWQFLKFIGRGLAFILSRLRLLAISLFQPGNSAVIRRKLPTFSTVNNLPQKGKIIGAIIIILIITFASIIFWPKQQANNLSNAQIQTILDQFNTKSESIEAALIYGNQGNAQNVLKEMHDLLATVPTGQETPEIKQMQQQITILTERIWNIREIIDPVIVYDANAEIPANNLQKVIAIKDMIYGFSDGSKFIAYDFNTKKAAINNYPTNFSTIGATGFSPNNEGLIVDQNKQLFKIKNDQLTSVSLQLSAGLKSITAIDSYFNRLYILDTETNQIYRHRAAGDKYQSPDLWLKDNIDMTGIKDFAVDGSVYLLKNNEIIKLLSGRKNTFAALNIFPPVTDAQKIFTSQTAKNIYILNPANQRVIVLDKQGKLLVQYHSNKFVNLKDFSVQEEAKRLFLINDKQIFVLPL